MNFFEKIFGKKNVGNTSGIRNSMAIEQQISNNDWYPFDNGKTISKKIIDDIEHTFGARITIEKDAGTAPFEITLGVYQLLFHTHFCSIEIEARQFVSETKVRIEKLFEHLDIPEEQQNEIWNEKYNQLKYQICEYEENEGTNTNDI